MGALKDCELVSSEVLGQPVNSLTALAFVIAGVAVWIGTRRLLVALGLVSTGVGSFLFHGPMPAPAQLLHDITLWFLVVVVGVAIISDLRHGHSWQELVGPGTLLGVVAVVGRMGATGNPLCDPESIWQPHGLWHIGAAIAVTWWAFATSEDHSSRRGKAPRKP